MSDPALARIQADHLESHRGEPKAPLPAAICFTCGALAQLAAIVEAAQALRRFQEHDNDLGKGWDERCDAVTAALDAALAAAGYGKGNE